MAIIKGAPRPITPEEAARLDVMTEVEALANAQSDPDNPPISSERLRRMAAARLIRQTRQTLQMSQTEFARTFHISLGRLQDAEQARANTDPVLVGYVKLIAADPDRARTILADEAAV
ncbi:MAG: transcriptional regulator [Pseudomonadota bacterium]|jgi:putative transcriptional regulator